MGLSGVATVLVERLGALGISLGVFLNGLGIPGISEVLLPLGGVAVRQGRMDFVSLFVMAMVAQLIGVSAAYMIARFGGLPMIERYGKYVFISTRELNAAERAFERYGSWLVVFGAFVPGIQGFIGYVAGVAQMNYARFLISVFIGKLVWIGGLLYLGMLVGDHIDLIDRGIKQIGVGVLVVLVLLGVWYVRMHRRHKASQLPSSRKEN
jgi:membrane protein DedA with SNARE-associated domain